MQFLHLLFLFICFILVCKCKSIIDQNDTALELLNNCKCISQDFCYKGHVNVRGVGVITLRNEVKNDTEADEIQCTKPSFVCCKKWKDQFGTRVDDTLSLFKKEEKTTSTPVTEGIFKAKRAQQRCGQPMPIINVRVHSSPDDISTAMDGEFPWMTSIYRKNQLDGSFRFRCGGSLINDRVVLTAAHCVYSSRRRLSELKIIANAKTEMSKIGAKPSDEREVKKITFHPDYYSGGAHNDIALIFLSKSYNESKVLNSICLPGNNLTYDKTRCVAAGWGEGNLKRTDGAKLLSKVELPIVDREKCQNELRKTKLGREFVLHESSICAGGEMGKDTCKGDGGGPLVCPKEDGNFIQVGIVSWGVDCSKENRPGVYTDVAKFVDWIHSSDEL